MMARSSNVLPDRIGMITVLSLAWPVMISRMSDTVMAAVDTAFVSRLGTDALAGVGLAVAGHHLIHAFGWGFLMGVRVIVSHRTGAQDPLGATRATWAGIWSALLFGAAAWLCLPVVPWALTVLGAGDGATGVATQFLQVRTMGAPLFFGVFALAGYFQGTGDTRTPMLGALAANAVNLALNPILIFGLGPIPAMGAAGSALATVLALSVNLCWLIWRFRRVAPSVSRRPAMAELRAISGPGLPMGLNLLQELGSFPVFMAILAHSGPEHIAAHVLVARVAMFSFLPGWAIGEAGGVLVGQALGAGRPALARQAWSRATLLALGLMGSWGLLFVAAPDTLLSVFSPAPEVLDLCRRMLWIAAAFQLFDAVATVGLCCLNGAGDNRFTMATNVVASWLVKVPLAWLFAVPLALGAPGAWMGMTIEIVALAAICLWRIRSGRWLVADQERAELRPAMA